MHVNLIHSELRIGDRIVMNCRRFLDGILVPCKQGQETVFVLTSLTEIEPYMEPKLAAAPIDQMKVRNYGPPRRKRW